MTTLYISNPVFLLHQTPTGHPERAERLRVIEIELAKPDFDGLKRETAFAAPREAILAVHGQDHIDELFKLAESGEELHLDADTWFGTHSLNAALHAAGAAMRAVDAVMAGEVKNAFCAVRPPGHHAEKNKAMGFCLFNNAAIAARHAQQKHGLARVAIVDFDVHHGNGTQDIFWNDANVFYASSHQSPCYPSTGFESETGVGNILNVELRPSTGSDEFRAVYQASILPALNRFKPEILILSAGFDAHWRDLLAQLELNEEDFGWVTAKLRKIAETHCQGRLVSLLEGGYDLQGLALSAGEHVRALMA